MVVVDIGGGTTDVALFLEGSLWHTEVLPIGGNHLTNDIAIGLRTPASEAEKIKIKYGCALSSLVKHEETLDVPSVGGRPPRLLSRQILCEIIEPRVEELFGMVQQRLKKTGFEDMFASGIVLTGGVALMEGVQEAAERYPRSADPARHAAEHRRTHGRGEQSYLRNGRGTRALWR